MSFVVPSQRRLVWPLAVALAAAAVTGLALYLPTRSHHVPTSPGAPAVVAATVADWELAIYPAGSAGLGGVSKKAKARVEAQRKPLATLIQDLYDALFLDPTKLEKAIGIHLEKTAGAALIKDAGLPKGLDELEITTRKARVGISVAGADNAAAKVKITGVATRDGRRTGFKHESTLWLERSHKEWKVIAFDLKQGPKR
ncbi:MAG TPA: hypothetical protein VNP73_07685 [Actinomycetota bacterium]|nr:hypothetical protein [Actinomycetota bacterium]